MNIPKKSIDRQVELALERGYKHSETKSKLRNYLDKIYQTHNKGNNMRVYNNHIFVFQNAHLITVLKLPAELQGNKFLIKKQRKECKM